MFVVGHALSRVWPHDLRASWTTLMLSNGVSYKNVKAPCGLQYGKSQTHEVLEGLK
jgi:integrase